MPISPNMPPAAPTSVEIELIRRSVLAIRARVVSELDAIVARLELLDPAPQPPPRRQTREEIVADVDSWFQPQRKGKADADIR